MAISPHVARLRSRVGSELLVLPSAVALPRDGEGRVLLVRHLDTGRWATIGGAVEPDESPADAAVREAAEEAGVELRLGPLLAVLGGPEYRVTYPNGDEVAYVPAVYTAEVIGGTPRPDGEETDEVAWWRVADLPLPGMGVLTRALLRDIGLTDG